MPTTSLSVFDRLSQQGTEASKKRIAEECQIRSENEQRRQLESAALTPTKNDRKLKSIQRSPASQDRMNMSPTQRDELYDRLFKQATISSAAHRHHGKMDNTSESMSLSSSGSPKRTNKELDVMALQQQQHRYG